MLGKLRVPPNTLQEATIDLLLTSQIRIINSLITSNTMKLSHFLAPIGPHREAGQQATNWSLHLWTREPVAVNRSSRLSNCLIERAAIVGEDCCQHQRVTQIWPLVSNSNSRRRPRTQFRFKTLFKCSSNKTDTYCLRCPLKANNNRAMEWFKSLTLALKQQQTNKSRGWAPNWSINLQEVVTCSSSNNRGTVILTLTLLQNILRYLELLVVLLLMTAITVAMKASTLKIILLSLLRAYLHLGAETAQWTIRGCQRLREPRMEWLNNSSLAQCGTVALTKAHRTQEIETLSLCLNKARTTIPVGLPQMF